MTAPSGRHETERRWLSEETEAEKLARWARRREAVALMQAAAPPPVEGETVGDQPEET